MGTAQNTRAETRKTLLLATLLIPLLTSMFLADLGNLNDYHGDENHWITVSSRAFQLYFVDHDVDNPFWRDDFNSWGAYQPQIGKYVIGLGTYLGGYRDIPTRLFDWKHTPAWNIEQGKVHPPNMIRAARTPIAIMGIATCLLLFWLVTLVSGHWQGYLAVCSFVGTRLFLMHGRRAMIDTPALCFSLLALVCLIYLVRSLDTQRLRLVVGWTIATGLACGLAVGSKMNALLIVGVCGVVLLVVSVASLLKRRWPVRPVLAGGLIVACTALIFWGSNPFLYHDPIAGARHMLSLTDLLKRYLAQWALPTSAAKLGALWQSILTYAPLNMIGLPGDRWLWLLGGVALAMRLWRSPRVFWQRQLWIIVVWGVVEYVGIAWWLPANMDRYFIPLLPINAFVQAYGVVWLWQTVSAYRHARTASQPERAGQLVKGPQ